MSSVTNNIIPQQSVTQQVAQQVQPNQDLLSSPLTKYRRYKSI